MEPKSKTTTIRFLHIEPIVKYVTVPAGENDPELSPTEISDDSKVPANFYKCIQQQSKHSDGLFKHVDFRNQKAKKTKLVAIDDDSIFRGTGASFIEEADKDDCDKFEMTIDLRMWTEPKLELQVGIDPVSFVIQYYRDIHALVTSMDPSAFTDICEKVGSSYGKLVMSISFLKFLAADYKSTQDDLSQFMIEIAKNLQEIVDNEYPPILLLMNINGCLIHRTKDRIDFKKHTNDKKYKRYVKFVKIKMQTCYFREGYLDFLSSLMRHPRTQFGFYSAIMQKNIVPILLNIFEGDDIGLYHEHMFSIFDQNHCEPSAEITGEKYGFIRDLSKVWDTSMVKGFTKQHGTELNANNTLMLESDECNVYNYHENSLIIDRYEREDVWPSPDKDHRDQKAILNSIKNDLLEILDRGCGDKAEQYDIRDVLKSRVFNHEDKPADDDTSVILSQFLRKARKITAAELAAERDDVKQASDLTAEKKEICELGDLLEQKLKI